MAGEMKTEPLNRWLCEQAGKCIHEWELTKFDVMAINEPIEMRCSKCGKIVLMPYGEGAPDLFNYRDPSNQHKLQDLVESKGYIWRLDSGITSNGLKSYRARLRKFFSPGNISIKAIEQTESTPSLALARAFFNAEGGDDK